MLAHLLRSRLLLTYAVLFVSAVVSPAASQNRGFVENRGQWPGEVLYLMRLDSRDVWVTKEALVVDVYETVEVERVLPERVREAVEAGALLKGDTASRLIRHGNVVIVPYSDWQKPTLGTAARRGGRASFSTSTGPVVGGAHHFFVGRDSERHAVGAQAFESIRVGGVADGVDLFLRPAEGQLDLILEVDTEAALAEVDLSGIEITVAPNGAVALGRRGGEVGRLGIAVAEEAPVTAGIVGGILRAGSDLLIRRRAARMGVGSLEWGTYLGGSETDTVEGIAVDGAGRVIVVGSTDLPDFPTSGGPYETEGTAAFVARLAADGTALDYISVIGTGGEYTRSVAVSLDAQNRPTVAINAPTGMPVSPGAYDPDGDLTEGFVARLSDDGAAIEYGTYVGMSVQDPDALGVPYLTDVTTDAAGRAVFTMTTGTAVVSQVTCGPDLLGTERTQPDGVVGRLSADGTALEFALVVGGEGADFLHAASIDAAGRLVFAGEVCKDHFFSDHELSVGEGSTRYGLAGLIGRADADGTAVEYTTTLVGVAGGGLETDAESRPVYVQSADGDAVVIGLTEDGSSARFTRFIGGSGQDQGFGVGIDSDGRIVVMGRTESSDFPATGPDPVPTGGGAVFITRLSADGAVTGPTLTLAVPEDTRSFRLALGPGGVPTVALTVESAGLGATPGAYDPTLNGPSDAFVARFHLSGDGAQDGPTVTEISPSNPEAIGAEQAVVVIGSGFTSTSAVTLRDLRTGTVYPNRTVYDRTPTTLEIRPNFGSSAARWSVEVTDGGRSSGPFEFDVEEPAAGDVSFEIVDLYRTGAGGLRRDRGVEGATVRLLSGGTVVATRTTPASGQVSFDTAPQGFDAVRITAGVGTDPATGQPVVLTHTVASPANGAEIALPVGFLIEHHALVTRLSSLTVEASLLFRLVEDDLRLPRSYSPTPASDWVQSWVGGTDDLPARSAALARLLIAEDALLVLVDQAGRASDQVADVSLDILSFAFIGEEVNKVLTDALKRSVLGEAAQRKAIREISDLIFWLTDQAGFYDDLPPSLKEAVNGAADVAAIVANAEVGKLGGDLAEALSKALIKDLIVAEFNRSLLGFDYVRRTQGDYDFAVTAAEAGLAGPSRGEYTEALAATTGATDEATRQVSVAVSEIEAARRVTEVEGLFGDLILASRGANPFLAVGLVLKGFEFATLREAGLLAADRYADVRDIHAVSATRLPFGPSSNTQAAPIALVDADPARSLASTTPDGEIAAYDDALAAASAAASTGDTGSWNSRVNEALTAGATLSSAVRPPLAALRAARRAATGDDSVAVATALSASFALDVARVELLGAVLAFGTDPSSPEPFVTAVSETRMRLSALQSSLDAATSVQTSSEPVLTALAPVVPDSVGTSAPFELAVEFVNVGGATAQNVRVALRVDSTVSVTNGPSLTLGDVEPGASARASWTLTASDSSAARLPFSARATAGLGAEVAASTTARGFLRVRSSGGATDSAPAPGLTSFGLPYPNPSAGRIRVPLSLSEPSTVRVGVYDALGRLVSEVQEHALGAGPGTLEVDASGLPSGVYMISIHDGTTSATRRVSVVQ